MKNCVLPVIAILLCSYIVVPVIAADEYFYASGENIIVGTDVSGDYTDTAFDDGSYSIIDEEASGGTVTVFEDDFETDKGWTHGGVRDDWERDAPQGRGGQYGNPDPSGDHTSGSGNVIGTDLNSNGDYRHNANSWIESPSIDCTGYNGVTLEFYRWLNVEGDNCDHAYVDVHNGAWNNVWSSGTTYYTDSSWNLQTIDISEYARGNNIRIRFRLSSDGSWRYCGWNIDDLKVEGVDSYGMNATYPVSGITTGMDSYTLNITGRSTDENFTVTADGVFVGNITYDYITDATVDGFEDGDIDGWITGGNANWFATGSVSFNGTRSAEGGDIGHNQETWIKKNITGPANITFYWKVSSELNYDYLRFLLDGTEEDKISGNVDWQQKTYPIPSGTHTIEWKYTKDGSVTRFSDTGWIDDIKIDQFVPTDVSLTEDITAVAGDGSVTIRFVDTESTEGTKDTLYIDQIEVHGIKSLSYGVSLTDPSDQSTPPEINATYQITVTNTGNVQDNFTLSVTNTDNAGLADLSSSLVSLGAGASTDITLNVTDSTTGTYNMTVTATSATYPGANDAVTIKTTVLSDTTPPVINSVALNATDVYSSDSILVTVNTTDDIGVVNVTANGVSLTYQSGYIWEGAIIASTGLNITVNVTAYDASGNNATDSSQSYNATDGVAPAPINDLSASTGVDSGEIDLTWTAPGDDGSTGTASGYIVRYSASQISNQSEFDSATDYPNSWTPLVAGSSEGYTLTGLTPNTTYYFAIVAFDDVPYQASISNSPSAVVQTNFTESLAEVEVSAYPETVTVGGSSSIITAYVKNDSGMPSEGASVTFTTDLGYFNETMIDSVTMITNATGFANATLISSDNPGNATIEAKTFRGIREIINNTTVRFETSGPGSLSLEADPTSATVNETSLITAILKDSYGNAISGATINFSVTAGNGSLGNYSEVTNGSGYALTTLRLDTKAGTNTVKAEVGALTANISVTGEVGPPAIHWLNAYPSVLPADGNATSIIIAVVFDQFYNPVSGQNVTFGVRGNTTSLLTNSTGQIAIGLYPSTKIQTVNVTSNTYGMNNSTIVSFVGGDPTYITARAQPSYIAIQGLPDVTNESMITATLTDDWNRPLVGHAVNFTTTNGTLSSDTAITSTNGEATVTLTSSYTPETVSVNATVESISSLATIRFTDQPFLNINTTLDPKTLTILPSYVNVTHNITGEGVVVSKPVDVVLTLDNSGSMVDSGSMYPLRDAAINFVNNLTAESRCAIYAFTGGSNPSPSQYQSFYQMDQMYPDINPTTGNPTGSNANGRTVTVHMIEWIAYDLVVNGNRQATPIWDTIGTSIDYAIKNNATDHIPVVVAMTDGDDTIRGIPDPTNEGASDTYCPGSEVGGSSSTTTWGVAAGNRWGEQAYYGTITRYYPEYGYEPLTKNQVRKGMLNASLPVFTIGLGVSSHQEEPYPSWYSRSTEYDLGQIANTSNPNGTHGKYYYAPSSSDLDEIYSEIYEAIQRISARIETNVLVPGTSVNGTIVYNSEYVNGSTTIIYIPSGETAIDISSEPTITYSGNNQIIKFGIEEAIYIGDEIIITYKLYVNGTGTIIGSSNISGADGTELGTFGPETVTYTGGGGGGMNTPPVADAGPDQVIILNIGSTVSFDGSNSTDDGTIIEYYWDFGDGDFDWSASPTMSHDYPSTLGTYTVMLSVTDNGNLKDDDAMNVTAIANPSDVLLSTNRSNIVMENIPGINAALITAYVTYGGAPVRDGLNVTFTTTLGVFKETGTATATSTTLNGDAIITLLSESVSGPAVITATEEYTGS
ncbi:MAG: invasin domain 3-containing protein, partial [Halobacteriota archaeon]|nr:invasin domain 3-containing protein [Halobacteriota archaeon]